MARIRQARRCSARRSNGQPCKAYAIVGGTVCRMHGGAAPQVRRAAYYAESERRARRQFAAVYARWQREWAEWQLDRITTTSQLLGVAPCEIHGGHIVYCNVEYGRPALRGSAAEPKIRPDRRYKMPEPPTGRRK